MVFARSCFLNTFFQAEKAENGGFSTAFFEGLKLYFFFCYKLVHIVIYTLDNKCIKLFLKTVTEISLSKSPSLLACLCTNLKTGAAAVCFPPMCLHSRPEGASALQ